MLEIIKEKETNFKEIFGAELYNKWSEKYSILENKDIRAWIRDKIVKFAEEGKDPVKFGFTSYIGYLQQYCDFNKGNTPTVELPSKLLTEDIDGRNDRLRKYLTFLYNAKEEEVKELGFNRRPSDVSIRNMIQSRIKGFYKNRGKQLSYGMKARKSGANKNEIYLEKEDIKQIQSKLESAQYRLINKFETQTGLRIDDVLNELTSGKYKIEKYKKHYFIKNFKSQKEMVFINFLFFTTELSDLLVSIYPKDKMEEIDLTKLFLSRNNKTIRGVDYLARVKAISKELGFNGNLKTHAFRKYFCDTIDGVIYTIDGVEKKDDKFNHHLEGREPNYEDATYITSLKNLKKYYAKWMHVEKAICIDCIIVDNTNAETVKHKIKIAKLEEQLNISVKENSNLSLRLDKLEEIIKKLIK